MAEKGLMSHFELRSFQDDRTLARTVAGQWLNELAKITASRSYYVALSGGRIAKRLFEEITTKVKSQRLSLDFVHFFWGDERCVPSEDPESNFAAANQLLLTPLNISADRVHRVQGELPPEKAAGQAEAEMLRIVAANPAGQPILDLILLGIGEDGHVASLFPGESEVVMNHVAIYRPVVATKPPPQRVTLGYPAIAAAQQVWVLASGEGKTQMLRESLSPEGRTPLARVLKLRKSTIIFTDLVL
jgi:6-phosphogluconolactonase